MRKIRVPMLQALLALPKRRTRDPLDLIIVGLGNPGREYDQTRHNVGAWCVDAIAKEFAISMAVRHKTSFIGEGFIGGHRVVLAKSRTFVNLSGTSAAYLLNKYKATPKRLLVIHDEINLTPGTIRLRSKGSAGGHNGIKSIIASLATQEFLRLKIGVGMPAPGADTVSHVLGNMPLLQRRAVGEACCLAVQAVEVLVSEGIDVAMNRFN